ncbi:hypothetical protein [Streptomyces spectabilis]|uniref:hypothetical protein n=1 Tax=Streptomyces spectabilis TaxID=68270 RepID=UPI001CEF8FE5|nr:hypothetical protein [Streptomyces spectabilis]
MFRIGERITCAGGMPRGQWRVRVGLIPSFVADISNELIMLERSAEEERAKRAGLDGEEHAAQWRRWYDASVTFQAAATAYAKEPGRPGTRWSRP